MATGDVHGNVDRLRLELRSVRYNEDFDVQGLREGNPAAFLPLLHYSFLGYSRLLARHLSGLGYELYAKSDLRFVESIFKILRDEFAYRPSLTTAQFLSKGFAERKLILSFDVVQLCKKRHNELWKESQPAKVHKVYKSPPVEEREATVRVVRETPSAAPPQPTDQASSSGRAPSAKPDTVQPNAGTGNGSKVAATAARFRSPTEPPPLPQALQKQRKRVSHVSNGSADIPSSCNGPQTRNPKPQNAAPCVSRTDSFKAPVSQQTDSGSILIDGSSRSIHEILRQFGEGSIGTNPPPGVESKGKNRAENRGTAEGRSDRGKGILDDLEEYGYSDGDADQKEMNGVEPAQLFAALQKQFDVAGNPVDVGRRVGRDDPVLSSHSSDEDGPLSAKRIKELADRNEQQIEELRTTMQSLEDKYSKMEQEALRVKENLQAKVTLLEGRVRSLEAAQAEKAKGAPPASPRHKPGPSNPTIVRQVSLPKRVTSHSQPAAPDALHSMRDVTNIEKSSFRPELRAPQAVETSPIKANRGTKDFIEKMRARFEATQELLRESARAGTSP